MSLTGSTLGKPLSELTLEYLQHFFSEPQEESSTLEFKSKDITIEMVCKEVSAFLNTEGGVLVLGAPMEVELPGRKEKAAKGELNPTTVSQDAIMRGIGSNISPAPINIKARSIPCGEGNVIILEVPQSMHPPHQNTKDGRYYIRLDREARSAPHGIVEALFFKRQKANVIGEVRYGRVREDNRLRIGCVLRNDVRFAAEKVSFEFSISGIVDYRSPKPLTGDVSFKDGVLKIRSLPCDFLMKGMSIQEDCDVTFRSNEALIVLSYWWKDGEVISKAGVFNVASQEMSEWYTSDKNGEEHVDQKIGEFKARYREELRLLLEGSFSSKVNGSGGEYIGDLLAATNKELPDSYLHFVLLSNGFEGRIHGMAFMLYSCQQVQEYMQTGFVDDDVVKIGEMEDYLMVIDMEDTETPRFMLLDLFRRPVLEDAFHFMDFLNGIVDAEGLLSSGRGFSR